MSPIEIKTMEIDICSPCLEGVGQECHTPGCALYLHRVDLPITKWLSLNCGWCGHWEKGQFTKEQVAEWLRVHRNATVGLNDSQTTTTSTCPHPCGSDQTEETGDEG